MSANSATGTVGNPTGGVSGPTVGLQMAPYNQVAPLTNQQTAGMQLVSDVSQPTQQALSNALNMNNYMGATGGGGFNPAMNAYMSSGGLMSPSSNPYLQQYAQNALQQQLQNYQQVTAPNLLQQAAQSGTLGSSGMAQGFNNAETALSQGIGNTLAGIYEPAYQAGLTATQNALNQGLGAAQTGIAQTPGLATAQYTPAQQLINTGALGQGQAQQILNTASQNLSGQANWPFQALGTLGSALSTLGGQQSSTVAHTPSTSAGKG